MSKRLVIFSMLAALLCGCGTKNGAPAVEPEPGVSQAAVHGPPYAKGQELFASAASEEAARGMAKTYGIELVSFDLGVAVFHTEENPFEVVARGQKEGWPPLEVNLEITLDEQKAN